MKRRFTLLPVCVALIAAGCTSQGRNDRIERTTPFEHAPLYGMVYEQDNAPCSGATVQVDGTVRAVADREGRFVIPALAPGPHRVGISKEGCEDLTIEIDYQDPSQVLYARVTSLGHLLAEAEAAMLRGDLGDASSLLDRATTVEGSDIVEQFLFAVLDFKRGNFAGAKVRLDALFDLLEARSENPPPVLYLFFADLAEYHLDRPDLAITALKEYLKTTEDPDTRSRLERLGGAVSNRRATPAKEPSELDSNP